MNPQAKIDNQVQMHAPPPTEYSGMIHCPICTHTVQATVQARGRSVRVKPGQKCPRCSSALDAGYVLHFDRAA